MSAVETDDRLPNSHRAAIMNATTAGQGVRQSGRAAGWFLLPARIPAFATATGAAAILAFAYFTASTPVQNLTSQFPSASPAAVSNTNLRVSQAGSEIVLEWTDGTKDSYTVRQATSAKAVYSAPGVEVKGHRYVDRSPSDAAVVYYLVE